MEIIFYELPKLEKYVREYFEGRGRIGNLPVEVKWGIYLGYRGRDGMEGLIAELGRVEEGIMRAERVMEKMNRDAEQWARAIFREKAAMDYRSGMGNAREDGIKIGEERATEKARKEKLESARKMKADGFTAEQIQKYAGLSPQEIRKL
jgi:predicted transposase/invertase (TIGR01784 family)